MTIRNKLIAMAVVVLLAIATMAGVTYYRGDTIITDLANTAGMEMVKSAANSLDGQFDKIQGVVQTAADSVLFAFAHQTVSDDDSVEKLIATLFKQAAKSGLSDIYMGHEATGKLSDGVGWKRARRL